MLLHVLHNGVNLALVRFREVLERSGWIPAELLQEQTVPAHVPGLWLAGSAVCMAVAVGMMVLGGKRKVEKS
jgi:hypothetical protein